MIPRSGKKAHRFDRVEGSIKHTEKHASLMGRMRPGWEPGIGWSEAKTDRFLIAPMHCNAYVIYLLVIFNDTESHYLRRISILRRVGGTKTRGRLLSNSKPGGYLPSLARLHILSPFVPLRRVD
jgi:hypothetical protein